MRNFGSIFDTRMLKLHLQRQRLNFVSTQTFRPRFPHCYRREMAK